MYQVFLTKTAQQGLQGLPKNLQAKCHKIFETLRSDPLLGKKLIGVLSSYRSIRLTTYRIIYRQEKEKLVIFVVSIRHRKEVYKKLTE